MQKTHRILTLVFVFVTVLALFTLSVSADYIRVPTDAETYGLKYQVGNISNLITVNGKANTESFSDTIADGGQSEGVYVPPDLNTRYPYYTISRQNGNASLTYQDGQAKYGKAPVTYYVDPTETLESIQHNASIVLEGKYADIYSTYLNDTPKLFLFIPIYKYHNISTGENYPPISVYTQVSATVTYLTEHNQRIEGSGASERTQSSQNGVTITPVIEDAINKAIASAEASRERLATAYESGTNSPSVNQRAKLTISVKSVCRNPENTTAEGYLPNQFLQIYAQYPLCNARKYFPNTATLPFNTVTNQIDSDFSLTEWFGASARGIWKFEIIPNVSIGGIVTAVLGISVTLAFLKFFAGG